MKTVFGVFKVPHAKRFVRPCIVIDVELSSSPNAPKSPPRAPNFQLSPAVVRLKSRISPPNKPPK